MNKDYLRTFYKDTDDDYGLVKAPNLDALTKAIDSLRGDRSIERYAYECGFSAGTLARTINGKRIRPISLNDCKAMYEHKAPESSITFEMLLAANGYVKKIKMSSAVHDADRRTAVLNKTKGRNGNDQPHSFKKKSKTIHKAVCFKPVPEKEDDDSLTFRVADEYKNFLKNLGIYSLTLTMEKRQELYKLKETLFNDNWLVTCLDSYVKSLNSEEKENEEMFKKYFSTGKDFKYPKKSASSIKQDLDIAIFH